MTTVAFVGLGAMGSRIAANLLQAGFTLKLYNRDRAKTAALAAKGATVADSPAAAAQGAAFVVSIVADDAASRAVMLGEKGVLAGAAKGTVVIDSSTNSPALARELGATAAAKQIAYLDAPVSGSLAQAQGKELVFLVGGDHAAFDQAQPLFAAMGRLARRIGGPGHGATLKLINNMLSATLTAALAEAALAAEAAGLDRDVTVEILGEGAAGCRLTKTKLPKMLKRDFAPQFQIALMDKDVRYFLDMAQALDRPTPIAALVRSQYQAARRNDLGKLDTAAVFLQVAGEPPKG
ncbi:MAG: NAD(P)-dependent oxidoreductase [Proteobacteria bacterium]|nr:NAD(P)-dependent oxidoreductase [Pseudomonadota bacterium]